MLNLLTKVDLSLSIEILWKGMLAIFIAMGIICLFTWFLNFTANYFSKKKK